MEWPDTVAGTPDRLQDGRRLSLRIVAGEFGGRRIGVPPGRQVRPTGERVREAWFSALGDRIRGATVIDLFSGSGALGIEALSRGAATVHFVEQDRRCFEVLRHNIDLLDISVRTRLHRARYSPSCPGSVTIRDLIWRWRTRPTQWEWRRSS